MPYSSVPKMFYYPEWGEITGSINNQKDLNESLKQFAPIEHEHPNLYQVQNPLIDEHLEAFDNPHQVDKSQVGLSLVTNDPQIKRNAGDFDLFTEKTQANSQDIVLIEDSEDSFNKKKITIENLRVYTILSHNWLINGEIFVADGDTNYICPVFVSCPTGKNIVIISAIYRLNSGGTVNVSVLNNSQTLLNYANISVTESTNQTFAESDEIADGDMLSLLVNSVNANPKNLTFTIFYIYI